MPHEQIIPVLPTAAVQPRRRNKLRVLFAVSFLYALSGALLLYAQSSFLEELVGASAVGIVFTVSYVAVFFMLNMFGHVLAVLGRRDATLLMLFVSIAALALLAYGYSAGITGAVLVVLFVAYLAANLLAFVGVDAMIETYSNDATTGVIRGGRLTAISAGVAIAPTFAGVTLDIFGFVPLFLGAAGLLIVAFFILLLSIHAPNGSGSGVRGFLRLFLSARRHPEQQLRLPSFMATLNEVFTHRALSHIVLLQFVLRFFYAWMVIYAPLYLLSLGVEWIDIGKVFSVMLLPFLLLEYPAGKIADRIGEKEMTVLGLFIMGVATIMLGILTTAPLWLIALTLFCTRVGAALVEVGTESYFFKHVGKRDVHLIDFFRNTIPVSFIVAPLLATVVLAAHSTAFLWVVLGIFCLGSIAFALHIKDTN